MKHYVPRKSSRESLESRLGNAGLGYAFGGGSVQSHHLNSSYYGASYQPEGITHADQKRPED